jgi:tetratricopeptide (TPR) repeat protein
MRKLWLTVFVAAAGCASAPINDNDVAALTKADVLVLEGCYDCLIEARDTYARVGVGRARPLVVARLFETEVLIALREKELAIDSAAAEQRAAMLTAELAPEVQADRALRIVDLVVPDNVGVGKARMRAIRSEPRRREVDLDAEVQALAASTLTPAVRQYLSLSLECSLDPRPAGPGQPRRRRERPTLPEGAPPLLAYRVAICLGIDARPLEGLIETSPRFIELGYFISRARLVTVKNDGAPGARALLARVYERFPTSSGVTYVGANYMQLIGDCREALRLYGETVALEPNHEDAMLGHAICHSFLKQHQDAIGAAATVIEWGVYNLADGYYWRAWNHHVLKSLDLARADIDSAKQVAATGEIYTLAGIIEHDQDDLALAERDLRTARGMAYGERNCAAAWYLGLVHMKQERWLESAGAFEDSMRCYEQAVTDSRAGLLAMRDRTDVDPDFKARQIEGFEAAVKEDQAQYHAAAFNAANQGARGGNIARAKELVEVAARDPALSDLVRQLREILRKVGVGGEA